MAAHIITILTMPIHIIGVYCILWKTPGQMKGIQFNILQVHLLTMVFDLFITFLEIPFLLLPYFIFYPLGIIRFLGTPNVLHIVALVINTGCLGIAMISILENRFNVFCAFYSPKLTSLWIKLRRPWLVTHYLLGIFGLTPFYMFVPDQEKAIKRIFRNFSCLPDYIYKAPFFVLAEDYTFHLLSWVTYLLLCNGEGALFMIFLVYNSGKQLVSKTMSKKSYEMQKSFLLGLLIWFSVVVLFIGLPMAYAGFSMAFDYYNQAFTNTGVIIGFTHGIVSTVTMIWVHRPYRDAVLKIFWSRGKLDSMERSSRSHRTINVMPRASGL